jgi:hypothetical protein
LSGPHVGGCSGKIHAVTDASRISTVLRLCEQIWPLREEAGIQEGHPSWVEGTACLHLIEDTQRAIDSYSSIDAFNGVGDAYLRKHGLLQAVLLQLDAVEGLARSIGARWKAGNDRNLVQALLTRNVVAGHPIGSRVKQVKYHHFHDRISLLDPGVIRFMSFSTDDPKDWTGGMTSVSTILASVAVAVSDGLREMIAKLSSQSAVTDLP